MSVNSSIPTSSGGSTRADSSSFRAASQQDNQKNLNFEDNILLTVPSADCWTDRADRAEAKVIYSALDAGRRDNASVQSIKLDVKSRDNASVQSA